MDVNAIAAENRPVLCTDTCSVLDVMRDPTRDPAGIADRQAAIDVVGAAETGRLLIAVAEQVRTEFEQHDLSIQAEAQRGVERVRRQICELNEISAVFGTPAPVISLDHLDDLIARSRAVVGRLMVVSTGIALTDEIARKGIARMNACIAPAKQGKDSSKDCLIYESYLDFARAVRQAGGTMPIVLLSSNVEEYLTEGKKKLKPEIEADFAMLNIGYAANMRVAKRLLGMYEAT